MINITPKKIGEITNKNNFEKYDLKPKGNE